MEFKIHNKMEIKNKSKVFTFYNTMLSSIVEKLSNFEPFSNYISIGTGTNVSPESSCKLDNYICSSRLNNFYVSNTLNNPFLKAEYLVDDSILDGEYITEIGLSGKNDDTQIFNYFNIKNEDTPNGILKNEGEKFTITIYIYFDISDDNNILISNSNKLIDLLSGFYEGEKQFSIKFTNNNDTPTYQTYNLETLESFSFDCETEILTNENYFEFKISSEVENCNLYEILFMLDENIIAVKNVMELKQNISSFNMYNPNQNLSFDFADNVKIVQNVTKYPSNIAENGYILTKYANSFSSIVKTNFEKMYVQNSKKFVSKDGKYIIFIFNNRIYVYAFSGDNFQLYFVSNEQFFNVSNIVCFNQTIWIFSKTKPYLTVFTFSVYGYSNIEILNLDDYENIISNHTYIDAGYAQNEYYFVSLVSDTSSHIFYFVADMQAYNMVVANHYQLGENYDLTVCLTLNDMCDGVAVFVKGGENAQTSKITYYYPDETHQTYQNETAYLLSNDIKEIYSFDNFIFAKNVSNEILFYHLKHNTIFQVQTDLESFEDSFVSTDARCLVKKISQTEFKFYSLNSKFEPTEFSNEIPAEIIDKEIIDISFLKDCVIIFTKSTENPVYILKLLKNKSLIENLSVLSSYTVSYKKYNVNLSENEKLIANLTLKVQI